MKRNNQKTANSCGSVENINWLQRIGIAGFVFFLAKGLLWIVALAWVAY